MYNGLIQIQNSHTAQNKLTRSVSRDICQLYKVHVLVATWGWSDGVMVLGKLPVSGHPTYLDYSRARAYCTCRRCWWGLFGQFFSRLSFLFSFSLSLGDGQIQTEILSQRADQPTYLVATSIKQTCIQFST